ncbi:type II/IV secretion system ATPase subunit [Halocatena pleomorpha]|uniref:Secretion system protein n=1 Tax=Halocatena pleomorpha TaxID=1785090 RepID=A0A3P3R6W1_9EURY|nr:type II/IV secretion system ATPase subunit [Halocatena pleomorpha]RRJ29186.1 secretion system protein [Halocatena pleomorpha]
MQAGADSKISDRYVPPPIPPDASGSWYAPGVCAQYEIHPGVVVTIRRTDETTVYEVREPRLTDRVEQAADRFTTSFQDPNPPPTRTGAIDRLQQGLPPKYEQVFDRVVDESLSCASRRRIEYYALTRVRCFGDLTPYALDDRLTERTTSDGELRVGTSNHASMRTGVAIDAEHQSCYRCLLSERRCRYTVSFLEFEIPVVVYRKRGDGGAFTTAYAVCEPDLLPGDGALLQACKERFWEVDVSEFLVQNGADESHRSGSGLAEALRERPNRITFVRERAKRLFVRRLTAQATQGRLDSLLHRFHAVLSEYSRINPPGSELAESDRLNDLLYYVLRDYIGYERLTIPIHDDRLEDIEVNRVGDSIKVVPRGVAGRIPTNIRFESESTFSNVVTQLAAADGVELNASTPSAKVNLDPVGASTDVTIRCALALGTISEGGPHVSIRKQRSDPLTPVELVQNGSIPTALVALLWLVFEHHGVVLFSGPTGVGKTTLMNAHIPFIPHDDRPISIDEGSREVRVPHETGVSLRTRDHQQSDKRVSMADLMTESNYLNPDVEIIAEINTPESFATFGESISTGHGIVGTTHAETIERLTNRVIEQGLPPHLLPEIDLVVFPRHIHGERYVGAVVELLSGTAERSGDATTIDRDGVTVAYNTVLRRTAEGGFATTFDPPSGSDTTAHPTLFERLASRTDIPITEIEASFRRKHRFVKALVEEDITEMDVLFERLARYDARQSGGT